MNSVVFRGLTSEISGYKNGFNDVLKTVRRWHDGEIIVSTWDNDILDFDKKMIDTLVLSKDPGSTGQVFGWIDDEEMQNWPEKGGANHINTIRQLTLAEAGAKAITGKKALLTRTDIRHGKNLFEIHERDDVTYARNGKRLIVPCVGTIWPDFRNIRKEFLRDRPTRKKIRFSKREYSLPFHMSDLFQCGDTEDIKKWASKEVSDMVISNIWTCRAIEQLWACSYLNIFKKYFLDFKNLEKDKHDFWKIMVSNFLVLGTGESRSINIKKEYRVRHRRRPSSKFYVWPQHYKAKRKEIESRSITNPNWVKIRTAIQ